MKDVCIVYSNISDENMDSRFGSVKEVNENREKFFKKVGLNPNDLIILELEHKDSVRIVSKKDSVTVLRGDALITKDKKLSLGILTSDCLPIVIYDPVGKVISLVHASVNNYIEIISNTVKVINSEFGSNTSDLKVEIGPAIGSCHYKMDLWKKAEEVLTGSGVRKENIVNSKICTYESNYFLIEEQKKIKKKKADL